MPRLPVFNNQAEINTGPVAVAARDAAQQGYYRGQMLSQGIEAIGRGVDAVQKRFYDEDAAAQKLQETNEISNLTVGMAETQAELSIKWQEYLQNADPNDTQAYAKFMDEVVTPAYDALGEGLTTQKGQQYFQVHRAKAWASIYKTSAADTSNMNAKNAGNKVDRMASSYSNASLYDPTNWQEYMEQADGAIDALADTHGLSKLQVEEMKDKQHALIASSAIEGMIKQNPEAALKALEDGEFSKILNGKQTSAAINKAESAVRSKENDAKSAENAETKKRRLEGTSALNDLEDTVVVDPVTGDMTVPPDFFTKIDDLSDKYGDVIPSATFRAAKNWAITETRRKSKVDTTKSDPTTYSTLVEKANEGTLTKDEVYQARANNYLSTKDFNFLKGWVAGGKKANSGEAAELREVTKFTKNFKGYIDDSLGGVTTSVLGKQRFADFQSDMAEQWEKMKAAGKTMTDFEDYVRKSIPRYVFSADEARKLTFKMRKGPVFPENVDPPSFEETKGKTMEEFLKGEDDEASLGNMQNKYVGPTEVTDTRSRTLVSYSRGGELPVLTGTQAGRQPLDMSGLNPVVLSKWERVQGILGYQVPVVSAYRDPKKNAKAGGAKKSQHMHGNAIDLDVRHMSKAERIRVIEVASALGFKGIGVYENSIHLDVGGRRVWGPTHHGDSIPAWAKSTIATHMKNGYGAKASTDTEDI